MPTAHHRKPSWGIALLSATLLFTSVSLAHAVEYVIDPTHTYASFEIDHHGFSLQRGWFDQTSGVIDFDPEAKTGRVDIRIAVASLDTGMAKRDEILRGENWFKAKDFPDILFRSEKLEFTDDKLTAVEGKLVMLGEIRPLRLEITRFKCGLNLANRKRGCGADAYGVLRRSEFGMEQGLPFIGDEVRLRIQVEAYLP
ncbi:MAG: polyisoprenoid-binding protein [Betaproteobacteria bacterium HGW-Betaproteobacteria-7]|jgi:polyisoprenoid-binding protein YceI|nr:MAG: polyisoprenoid-binding protein [Betaproteobacteria bacterium HGW-Betaproteobacteria-7]